MDRDGDEDKGGSVCKCGSNTDTMAVSRRIYNKNYHITITLWLARFPAKLRTDSAGKEKAGLKFNHLSRPPPSCIFCVCAM